MAAICKSWRRPNTLGRMISKVGMDASHGSQDGCAYARNLPGSLPPPTKNATELKPAEKNRNQHRAEFSRGTRSPTIAQLGGKTAELATAAVDCVVQSDAVRADWLTQQPPTGRTGAFVPRAPRPPTHPAASVAAFNRLGRRSVSNAPRQIHNRLRTLECCSPVVGAADSIHWASPPPLHGAENLCGRRPYFAPDGRLKT